MTRPLSQADELAIFRDATSALARWYADELNAGMTDMQLGDALARVLGIAGGKSGPGKPDVWYKGAGLKIWGGWEYAGIRGKPLFQGAATIAMARSVYRISDPTERQLALF